MCWCVGVLVCCRAGGFVWYSEHLALLQGMGFEPLQCTLALRTANNNVDRAMNMLLEHPDKLDKYEPLAFGARFDRITSTSTSTGAH